VPPTVNRVDCCTPDWFPIKESDLLLAHGPEGELGLRWTQLWTADAEGDPKLGLRRGRAHVYGGMCRRMQVLLFTGNMKEDAIPRSARRWA